MENLFMVLIKGPSVKDSGPVVKLAVKHWLRENKRKRIWGGGGRGEWERRRG